MSIRRRSLRALFFAFVTSTVALSTLALAQPKPKPKPPAKPPATTAPAGAGKKPAKDAGPPPMVPDTEKPDAGAPAPAHTGAASPQGGGQGDDVRVKDGGGREFRFGELEIEGRLKSPQIVYFLRRVRAEFAAGDLGHRTFMREMSDTRNDPAF